MGQVCDCSGSKKDEALLAQANESGKATVKKPRDDDESERSYSNSGTMNGAHSNKVWYQEPDELEDGDIVSKLEAVIGSANKKEIEIAISKVKDKMDINAVCQYMINTATDFKESVEKDSKSKHVRKEESVTSSNAFIRITIVLEAYVKWIKTTRKKKSFYDIVHRGNLGGKGHQFSIKQILDDFLELLYCYNSDEDFQTIYRKLVSKQLIIPLNKSSIITRVYRDRLRINNDKQRKSFYFGYTESKEVTIIQLMDRIYVYYAYSFELGLRLTMKEKLSILYAKDINATLTLNADALSNLSAESPRVGDDKDADKAIKQYEKDPKLVCLNTIIKKKQINLENIIGKKRMTSNKFVTANKTEAAMFFYKDTESKENDADHDEFEFEGKECKEKDWLITKKYESLKVELTQNEKIKMTMRQFEDLLILADLHCGSEHNKLLQTTKLNLDQENEHAESQRLGLNNMHVLAVMVYCHFVSVQFELKQTYYRKEGESDKDFKSRHAAFANLGSLLKQAVCDFGEICSQKSEKNTFYHSISMESISMSLVKFRAPTSTSTSKVVLFNYSSIDGTIIELNSGYVNLIEGDKCKYFDCCWLSDFGIEDEQLFIQQDAPLELSNIENINAFENYQLFTFALNIITCVFGEVNIHWAEDKKNPFQVIPKPKRLQKLVKKILERKASQVQPHLFGKKKRHKEDDKIVLLQLLEQFCINKKEMKLFWFSETTGEHWPWMDELLTFMKESVFCKELKGDTTWVKLDLLSLFFINLESITIVDCQITDAILIDIDLFIQKLQVDPNEKYKDKNENELGAPDELKKDESEMDKLIDIDIDALVGDLKSEKSHISFKDPNFDDLCDYRQTKIKEIKILESYDQDNPDTIVKDKMMRKYNRKFKKCGWEMYKGKVIGNYDGFIFRKIGKVEKVEKV